MRPQSAPMSPNEPPMSPNEPPMSRQCAPQCAANAPPNAPLKCPNTPPIYYQHATKYTPPIICIFPISQQDKNVFFIYQFLRYTKVIKKVNTQEG